MQHSLNPIGGRRRAVGHDGTSFEALAETGANLPARAHTSSQLRRLGVCATSTLLAGMHPHVRHRYMTRSLARLAWDPGDPAAELLARSREQFVGFRTPKKRTRALVFFLSNVQLTAFHSPVIARWLRLKLAPRWWRQQRVPYPAQRRSDSSPRVHPLFRAHSCDLLRLGRTKRTPSHPTDAERRRMTGWRGGHASQATSAYFLFSYVQ